MWILGDLREFWIGNSYLAMYLASELIHILNFKKPQYLSQVLRVKVFHGCSMEQNMGTVQVERRPTAGFSCLMIRKTEGA